MRTAMKAAIAAITVSALAGIGVAATSHSPVPYPDGYRTWQHAKTMLIQPGHALENPFGGIHHIYVNEAAMDGLREGSYADGAVFVFDLLGYHEADNTIVEGERKLVGVMHRDAEAYADTGGWGFEGFAGNSKSERLVTDGGTSCYGCHTAVTDSEYVFTQYRR